MLLTLRFLRRDSIYINGLFDAVRNCPPLRAIRLVRIFLVVSGGMSCMCANVPLMQIGNLFLEPCKHSILLSYFGHQVCHLLYDKLREYVTLVLPGHKCIRIS